MFALLTFLHFAADWVFQSHAEAMAKSTHGGIRAKHCLIYTVICCGVIAWVAPVALSKLVAIATLLFISHFFEDTYLPVYVWARYIRKPLEMQARATVEEFTAFASTALGKILLIAIDQIVHILFLIPVAVILVVPARSAAAIWTGGSLLVVLGALCAVGAKRIQTP